MYRKYISSVAPLADYILQVDFVSGSRLLLDMKPYRDKFRFQSIFQPQVWNSAVTNASLSASAAWSSATTRF